MLKRYLKLAVWLLLYTVILYHLAFYDSFPLSPNYHFPGKSILIAYSFSLPLTLLCEGYFQYLSRKTKNRKKAVTQFLRNILISLILLVILAFYTASHNIQEPYYLLASILLSIVSGILWIGFHYGKTLFLWWTYMLPEGDSINIKNGKTVHRILFDDLIYFLSKEKIVYAYLKNGKKLLTNFNLAELENSLPQQFFRINRQYIVNRKHVGTTRSIENQKIEIGLKDAEEVFPLIVSRYRATDFRKWLQ